jgi:alpha-tubulin suppressor-like RCC1 family protein
VLTTSGGVKCWGSNSFGQLGNNTTTSSPVPIDVPGLDSGVLEISTGGQHACARLASGLKCWGANLKGQLGNNTETGSGPSVPTLVTGIGSDAIAISLGGEHSCALLSGGEVKCWGRNSEGQLGNNTTTASPVPVSGSGLTSGVVVISSGAAHTCVVMETGAAKCWGSNLYGKLGDKTRANRLMPVAVTGFE